MMKKIFTTVLLAAAFAPTVAFAAPRATVARVRTIHYHDRTPHVKVRAPGKSH